MDIDEIINYISEENPDAIAFRNPGFYDAIIGYAFNENDLPVVVYDYNKMIESLAAEYDDAEDPIMDAIEWINYNTLRTLPYIPIDVRPIIMYH